MMEEKIVSLENLDPETEELLRQLDEDFDANPGPASANQYIGLDDELDDLLGGVAEEDSPIELTKPEPKLSQDEQLAKAQETARQIIEAQRQAASRSKTRNVGFPSLAASTAGLQVVTATPCYPDLPLNLEGVSHDELMNRISLAASQYRKSKNYLAVRDEFVRVSLALNQFGLLAPVFRDQPRIPYSDKKRDATHTQLLIDQIVIDCHWLACRREPVKPKWPELRPIFAKPEAFDCAVVANQVGSRNWSGEFRSNELFFLDDRQQVQLAQIRSKKLKEKFRALVDGERILDPGEGSRRIPAKVAAVRHAINNHRKIRGHEEMYAAIWVAAELLGPKASSSEIAELAGLQCGVRPLHPRTVRDKMATLKRILDEAGIAWGR